ncbi:MAG: PHP domain-containing protein [Peptococcaceae bacterium]|nr:PHP domain-containing protein [Peptococcaceae bacterium]
MKNKSKYEADLHCHTSASDGSLSPEDTVKLAKEKGLLALAITDHDTIEGWGEADKAAKESGILLLKGIEINTDWEGKEVHILGYGMKDQDPFFLEELLAIQKKRISRIEKILKKLRELGYEISFEEVIPYAHGESIGRPHVAQAMMRNGFVSSVKEAFDRFLRIGAPAYVPRYKLTPVEAIHIIRQAGGVAVLAHPGASGEEKHIQEWIDSGLQGLEVYHPDHTFADNIRYGMIAEKNGLIATGGSDFHGDIKPDIELGEWGVGLDIVEQIINLTAK